MQAVLSLFERIIHVQLYGKINTRMVQNLKEGLIRKHMYSVQLIAVSINSQGGSITQAKNINSILRKFSEKTRAPIFTFAEDFSLNAANIVLTGGNKCFANQHSMIGEHGFSYGSFGYKDLINKYDVQAEYITQGKNKVKINPFDNVTPEGSKWVQNILDEMEYDLKGEVIKNRGHAFQKQKLTNEALEKEVFQKPILTADEALNYGLIDGISTMEQVISEKIGHAKQIDVMKQGFFDERLRIVPEKVYTDISMGSPLKL